MDHSLQGIVIGIPNSSSKVVTSTVGNSFRSQKTLMHIEIFLYFNGAYIISSISYFYSYEYTFYYKSRVQQHKLQHEEISLFNSLKWKSFQS